MFRMGMGMKGAALATVVAQYVGLVVYLCLLLASPKSPIAVAQKAPTASVKESWVRVWVKEARDALPTFKALMLANLAMIVRNGSLLSTWALATATATRMGHLHVAAHQVTGAARGRHVPVPCG
jgi:Na+-driven multidrug efflux pump